MKVKTSDLIGPALDWAVAKCRGFEGLDEDEWLVRDGIADMPLSAYTPSTDWAQGGPIIEQERIEIYYQPALEQWAAKHDGTLRYGQTPLIAAMLCYVASKMGDDIEVPDELFKE